jgi:hypothetical protein
MQSWHFLYKNIRNIYCLVSIFQWNKMGIFCKLVHHHHDRIMHLSCSRQSRNKIHCYYFPLPFRNGQRLHQPFWVPMLIFKFLVFHTSSDVFNNLSLHTWLKVMALDRCHNFLISRVPCIWNIMHFMQNHMFQVLDICNKNSFLVQQYSIYSQIIIIHLLWHLTLL